MQTTETKHIGIIVNGEDRSVPDGLTLAEILHHLGVEPTRVAVEMNRSIVRKTDWANVVVQNGSALEIVQFVGGG